MSVNLQKGQKIDLRKKSGDSLRHIMIGLGWDEAEQPKKGLASIFKSKTEPIDCDASALVCTNGKVADKSDIVSFLNLAHKSGAIKHMGDNLTGAGNGDDEQIIVDLDKIPASCDKIIFVVNIYMAEARKQHFGMIKNAFIRIVDSDTGEELCIYNLSENYDGMTAMIFGQVYKDNGAWKFSAIGQATKDDDIASVAKRYK